MVRVFQSWGFEFKRPHEKSSFVDWYSPKLWHGVSIRWALIAFGVVPLAVYFLMFVPLLLLKEPGYGWFDLIALQEKMWDGQMRVTTPHPYMSQWWQWLVPTRPIWYAFDKEGDAEEWVRGVFLLGNPVVMWAGLAALGACVWGWVKHRSRAGFLIVCFFAMFYLSWILIPRKVSFYYYFYPAAMVLSLALGFVAQYFDQSESRRGWPPVRWAFLVLTIAVFAYFFPILAALRVPSEAFVKWMWLPSWI
jgi:dolichyl-phosphate-mannose--protein O-mannosyl transferase